MQKFYKYRFLFPIILQILFAVNICQGVTTTITKNSTIEEIKEELNSMNIPVLSFTFEEDQLPSYDVIEAPEGCWGTSITNNEYVKGKLIMTLAGEEIYNSGEYEDKESGVRVKYRGNTSTAQDYIIKKSFKIKLSKKADLLLRDDKKYKDKEWVLLNGNKDINYVIGTQVARICGMEWEPEGKSVCVIMNNQYMGYYYLVESVKASEARVDIQDTGFIIENDAYWWKPDELYFKTKNLPYSMGWTFKEPDPDDIEEETVNQIKNVVESFENSLYSHGEIEEMYDRESFARWILSHDILGTLDGGGSNMFITKEDINSDNLFGTKLKMGPLWDFDESFKCDAASHVPVFNSSIFWYQQLFMYSDFYEIFLKNWEEVKDILLEELKPVVEKYFNDNPEIYKARLIDSRLGLLGKISLTHPQTDSTSRLKWLSNRLEALDNLYKLISVAKIILRAPSSEVNIGDSMQMELTIYPENATEKTVIWNSSDPLVATISEDGLVQAISEGNSIITATCGELSSSFEITVVNPVIEPEKIILNEVNIDLFVGDSVQIEAKVLPENTTDKTVVWQSSDENIVKVSSEGVVMALTEGTAVVTASCGEVSSTCEIKVKPVEAVAIHLDLLEINLLIGETGKITATVYPENTTDKTLSWSSSNEDIATISPDGIVEAIAEGMTIITVSCGEVGAICVVNVINPIIAAKEIELRVQETVLNVGETLLLEANVYPENTTDKTLSWSSSNEDIATISQDGIVEAITPGTAIITVSCGEVEAVCIVNVVIVAEEIELSVQETMLNVGETLKLDAMVFPEDTTDQTVTWSSSNEEVALVSEEGLVTAISEGVTVITAECGEVSAECTITVLDGAGVESLLSEPNVRMSIYTVEGMLIKKDCQAAELKKLAKGLYIIVSEKGRFKISI